MRQQLIDKARDFLNRWKGSKAGDFGMHLNCRSCQSGWNQELSELEEAVNRIEQKQYGRDDVKLILRYVG